MDEEFFVHGVFLSKASNAMHSFLLQPSQNNGDNDGENKRTLQLPDGVNQKVAIKLFKTIYHEISSKFPAPTLDDLNPQELKSFYYLTDMYILDSGNILTKTAIKKNVMI